MGDLSKESVRKAIEEQYARPPQVAPQGLLGVPGTPRDPLAMRARQEYNRYAIEMQQQGLPPLPFEDWQKQNLAPPQPAPRGLLDFFRR